MIERGHARKTFMPAIQNIPLSFAEFFGTS